MPVRAPSLVHTVLVEESPTGWKEYELSRSARHAADNPVVNPFHREPGRHDAHTGDSIHAWRRRRRHRIIMRIAHQALLVACAVASRRRQ